MGLIVQTKYVGQIEIERESIIEFEFGLPGFPEEKQFILLNIPGNTAFQTLQSTQTPDLAFVVTNPYFIYESYTFKLDQNIITSLAIEVKEDVKVLSIVTLKEPFSMSTLNLKAPIIINVKHSYGKQYILNDDNYLTKAPIIPPEGKGI